MENARLLDEIRQRQEELRVTFENMGDGVAMFDDTQHLVAWNRKFQDILDVPDDIIARRQTFTEYVRYLADRGEYGVGPGVEEQVRRLTERVGQYRAYERTRPDGRVIEIRHNPVPNGGFVLIFSDITERKRNEAEIHASHPARSLPSTSPLSNTCPIYTIGRDCTPVNTVLRIGAFQWVSVALVDACGRLSVSFTLVTRVRIPYGTHPIINDLGIARASKVRASPRMRRAR